MPYIAYQNVPGYLPDTADEHPQFDTAQEAWQYLADERAATEDMAEVDHDTEYLRQLQRRAATPGVEPGVILASTPGGTIGPDLGIVYTVERVRP